MVGPALVFFSIIAGRTSATTIRELEGSRFITHKLLKGTQAQSVPCGESGRRESTLTLASAFIRAEAEVPMPTP